MTNKQAIGKMNWLLLHAPMDEDVIDALDLAVEALEKQVLHKVFGMYQETVTHDETATFALCPICRREVQEDMNYCYNCGQALDWSE